MTSPLPISPPRPADPPRVFRGYPVRSDAWVLAGQRFELCWPADMDALLDDAGVQARHAVDGYMPYWAQPWPAAVLLAEAVLRGEDGAGRSAIEIGCGVGLVSLAAARAGWRVTATDYDADAVAFAALNAERNGLSLDGCRCLDYRSRTDGRTYDLVLGADLLYERRNAEPLAGWIASALAPGGAALVSDPNRSAAETFPETAYRAAFGVSVTPVETTSPAGLLTRGRIWRLTRCG